MPEAGEAPADLFNAGFLPSARGVDQFYLCRNVRVNLAKFKPSSENRRILRKGAGIEMKLLPRAEFDLTAERREFYQNYADARFGKDVMPPKRLELTFNSPVATHLLVFTNAQSGAELGVVVLYLELPRLAFYRYAFYDWNHPNQSLGLFMMTSAVAEFAARGAAHLYLGTCYSERALYKTQFAGVEFFNGFRWSDNLAELKFLIQRDQAELSPHLLESDEYRKEFHAGDLGSIAAASAVRVKRK
jgi:arginyl-tRNA--protein-N-Asp/Glu arginylyltransferase